MNTGIQRYIDDVRNIPKLTREEEFELAMKAKSGDQAAIDAIVKANLRHAVSIALSYKRYAVPLPDLIAEANVGLMTAIKKFEPERGFRFVTYAGYWMRAMVLDAVVRSTTMVGGGAGALRSKLFFRLRRERAQVATLTDDPQQQLELMAERFDTTKERIAKMLQRIDSRDVSLNAPAHDDSGSELQDQLRSYDPSPHEAVASAQTHHTQHRQIHEAMNVLDDRERLIIERRVLSDESESLAAIGRSLGVSRERARQLEARAKNKLRKQLKSLAPAAA